MKQNIHPQYYTDVTVTCSCGNTFKTGSTKSDIHVDICSACHPFFTGEMKFVDVQGRVEKFQAKQAKAQALQSQAKVKKLQKKQSAHAKSLKDMLTDLKAQQSQAPASAKKS